MSEPTVNPRAGKLLPAHYWDQDQPVRDGRRQFTVAALAARVDEIKAAIAAVEADGGAVYRPWREELVWRERQIADLGGR